MATSLYDLSVPTFLQTVRAVGGFLDRAAKHCAETGADPDAFVQLGSSMTWRRSTFRSKRRRTIACGGWRP